MAWFFAMPRWWRLTFGAVVAACGALAVTLLTAEPDPALTGAAQTPEAAPALVQPEQPFTLKPTPAIEALAEARPIWVQIDQPEPAFALAAPALDGLPHRLEARRHGAGGREDTLVDGTFAADALHLRLTIYRPGEEATDPGTFFVDLVRRAAEAGVAVIRTTLPRPADSKFGPLETAEALLSAEGTQRACLAFRLAASTPHLRLSGWACGTQDKPVDAARLTCLLDGLTPLSTARGKQLQSIFAAAEQRRSPHCGANTARPHHASPRRPV